MLWRSSSALPVVCPLWRPLFGFREEWYLFRLLLLLILHVIVGVETR